MDPDRPTNTDLADRRAARLAVEPFLKPFEQWQKRSAWLRGTAAHGDRSGKLRDSLWALRAEVLHQRGRFHLATASAPRSYPIVDLTHSFERLLHQLDDALAPWAGELLSHDAS